MTAAKRLQVVVVAVSEKDRARHVVQTMLNAGLSPGATVAVSLRVRVVVVGVRAAPVVVGPQVVADLVYVRQVVDAVHVDDGVRPRLELRVRSLHHVPDKRNQATQENKQTGV